MKFIRNQYDLTQIERRDIAVHFLFRICLATKYFNKKKIGKACVRRNELNDGKERKYLVINSIMEMR